MYSIPVIPLQDNVEDKYWETSVQASDDIVYLNSAA